MNETSTRITGCAIIIGNEILSGRTQDSNLSFLGRRCDELGIRLTEARVIPDEEDIIIKVVNECRDNFDYVFTTGGIGPTHDDITAASIARAFDVELERSQQAVQAMQNYYEPGKLNQARLKMADIPQGAVLIDNPVSGAPGFQMENVFVLPGVPMIMQVMFDGISDRFTGGAPILTRSIMTDLTEGVLAEGLGLLQGTYPGVSIGSYPYFRHGRPGVNIVMRTTDKAVLEQLMNEMKLLIENLNGLILS